MRALLDVNFLLAMVDVQHAAHETAHTWYSENIQHGWASSPITQNGFVHVISLAAYPRRFTVARALETLRAITQSPGHEFWPDDISIGDEEHFASKHIIGPKQITDIYLLGLAARHGGRLVTFDRRIAGRAVRQFRPEHYLIVG